MAAMEVDLQEQSNFDLEVHISSYTGHIKVNRLLFIANRSAGKPLELEALKLVHDQLRRGEDVKQYADVCSMINGRLGHSYHYDRNFAEAVDRRSSSKYERLESELQGYKTNLIKESIRLGYNDLGDFHYEKGDLANAFKCYVRSRDYCTTAGHLVSMCLRVIKAAIELGNFMHVANYVAKAEQATQAAADPQVAAKLRAATGLAHLQHKKYKLAGKAFMEVGTELGNSFSDVIAQQDVAYMGGLCALATFDREELKSKVIANLGFKEFLELVPEMREIIQDFYFSRYASCLSKLATLRPILLLDLHLAEHVDPLYAAIRQRALVQYTIPFLSVNMQTMAEALNTNVQDLEGELALLIMEGSVKARIDSHAKVLYARHANVRADTFHKVLAVGEEYLRDTKSMLLRSKLLQHEFMQKGPVRKAGGVGGGSSLNFDDLRRGGGGGGGGGAGMISSIYDRMTGFGDGHGFSSGAGGMRMMG